MRKVSPQRENDERVSEVIRTFYESKVCFDDICERYSQDQTIDFSTVNDFVEKCVFELKGEVHLLFRNDARAESKHIRAEDLFDVLIGSVFHELMKVKECSYQIQQYAPRYRQMSLAGQGMELPGYEQDFLKACNKIITRARRAVRMGMASVAELYRDTCEHLERMIPQFQTNRVLVRMLVQSSDLLDKAAGTGASERILAAMFNGQLDEAYLAAAREFLEGGWYARAQEMAERAREINPDNLETAPMLEKLEQARDAHRV